MGAAISEFAFQGHRSTVEQIKGTEQPGNKFNRILLLEAFGNSSEGESHLDPMVRDLMTLCCCISGKCNEYILQRATSTCAGWQVCCWNCESSGFKFHLDLARGHTAISGRILYACQHGSMYVLCKNTRQYFCNLAQFESPQISLHADTKLIQ